MTKLRMNFNPCSHRIGLRRLSRGYGLKKNLIRPGSCGHRDQVVVNQVSRSLYYSHDPSSGQDSARCLVRAVRSRIAISLKKVAGKRPMFRGLGHHKKSADDEAREKVPRESMRPACRCADFFGGARHIFPQMEPCGRGIVVSWSVRPWKAGRFRPVESWSLAQRSAF